jgi:hypothetical protein
LDFLLTVGDFTFGFGYAFADYGDDVFTELKSAPKSGSIKERVCSCKGLPEPF